MSANALPMGAQNNQKTMHAAIDDKLTVGSLLAGDACNNGTRVRMKEMNLLSILLYFQIDI